MAAVTPVSHPPNFDRLARVYRWMEYLSFGTLLERCRFRFLHECGKSRQALILGDGDGRFTARLLSENCTVRADAIDLSRAMLDQLTRRVSKAAVKSARTAEGEESRLRTVRADIRQFSAPASDYDLVVSHFFLDCLTEQEVERLVQRIVPHLTRNARWLISEFAIPEKGWRRIGGRALVRFLYFAFEKIACLDVREIPDYATALSRHGFRRQQRAQFAGGLLVAEVWERDTQPFPGNCRFSSN